MSRSVAFLTLRMSLTALVLAACGPPVEMAALMSSLYILRAYDASLASDLHQQLPEVYPGERR